MAIAATFRVENDTFADQLKKATQKDKTAQAILKEIS